MHPLLFFAIEIFSGVGVVLLLSVLVELCPSVPRMLSQMRKKLLPARLQRGGANAQLVEQLQEFADSMQLMGRDFGNPKYTRLGKSCLRASKVLSAVPYKVTSKNLKAVAALSGIDKDSLARIKQYTKTGRLYTFQESEKWAEEAEEAMRVELGALRVYRINSWSSVIV